jgi:hypothetical protein
LLQSIALGETRGTRPRVSRSLRLFRKLYFIGVLYRDLDDHLRTMNLQVIVLSVTSFRGEGIFQQSYLQLLNGFLDKLTYYVKNQEIRITHLLATAWTPEGRKMCGLFGMTEVGKDGFSDPIFELDLRFADLNSKSGLPGVKRLIGAMEKLRH